MNAQPPTTPAIMAEVRAEMARQGLNMAALAVRVGVPYSTLRSRLHSPSVTLEHLLAISNVLGVSLAELTNRAKDNAPEVAA